MYGYYAKTRVPVAILSIMLVVVSTSTSQAQNVQGQDADDGQFPVPVGSSEETEAAITSLDQIVVTAQRRGQDLQDVPITLTALSANAVEAAGVRDTEGLAVATPGLVINRQGAIPQIYIRGVGTQNIGAGEEPSNSVYVDGIYYTALPGTMFGLNNIDRIETLKGPQGTLFGRNATGGLIHIITRDPEFSTSGEVSLGYGNFDTFDGQAYFTGPLSERIAADIALQVHEQGKGYGMNRATDREVYASDELSLRTKLLWNAGEATRVHFAADHFDVESSMGVPRWIMPGAVGLGGTTHSGGFWDVENDVQPTSYSRQSGASLRVEHDLAWAHLLSLSGYRNVRSGYRFDQDGTTLPLVDAHFEQRDRQFTQELQLQSLPGGRMEWIVGAFFLAAEAKNDPIRLTGAAQGDGVFTNIYSRQETSSYAAFAQATFPLGESTRLTAGVRYTTDDREMSGYVENVTGVIQERRDSFDAGQTTYRLAVDHRLGEDVLVYGSYNRGFKSGVYNLTAIATPHTRPEILDAYEIGLKSEFADRRVRLNGSLFYYDYQDIQLTQISAGTQLLLNAAEATLYGLDADLTFLATDRLRLGAGLNLLRGEYDSFPDAPRSVPNGVEIPDGVSCPSMAPTPPGGNRAGCVADASGNDTIRSPDVTFNVSAEYYIPSAVGDFVFNANYYYNDGYAFEPDGRLRQPGYALLNAQVAWHSGDDGKRVRLWARNLLGEKYFTGLSSSVQDNYSAAPPRTFGVEFTSRF